MLDYIIANKDRHWNNFGAVRNAKTLEWIGLAPIFDSGTSLWHDTPHIGADVKCKPFRRNYAEQIKLVDKLSWFDFDSLKGLDNKIKEILSKSEYIDEIRRDRIATTVMDRCEYVDILRTQK